MPMTGYRQQVARRTWSSMTNPDRAALVVLVLGAGTALAGGLAGWPLAVVLPLLSAAVLSMSYLLVRSL